MKFLRLVLIGVLTLSLPIYGQAAVDVSSQCMMQTSDHAKMPDCCPECPDGHKAGMDGKTKPDHQCKSGQECKACNAYQPSATQTVVRTLPVSHVFVSLPDEIVFSQDPDGFWRPPRSI